MSYEDKTKLYTQKELDTVLEALCKLEKESKPALKLEELVKGEINNQIYLLNTISPNIPPQTTAYEYIKETLTRLQSLVEKSQNTKKEEWKAT